MNEATMEAAALTLHERSRGPELLLQHCLWIAGADEPRVPAAVRLEQKLGRPLSELLLQALAPQGRRGTSSP